MVWVCLVIDIAALAFLLMHARHVLLCCLCTCWSSQVDMYCQLCLLGSVGRNQQACFRQTEKDVSFILQIHPWLWCCLSPPHPRRKEYILGFYSNPSACIVLDTITITGGRQRICTMFAMALEVSGNSKVACVHPSGEREDAWQGEC